MLHHVKISFTYRNEFWFYGIHLYNNKEHSGDYWTDMCSETKAYEKAKEHGLELPENPEENFTIEKIIK